MAVSRKTVTVLFADVAGSTALGERHDPEAVRDAMSRWFEDARAVIERHGGTVEKFIGDAVMAVFGIPQLHEDDAVRAVSAAHELRGALAELNAELERERGLNLAVRVGINTGEVVAGDGGTLLTGDAINVAKRLEEAAETGEILVGEATQRLAHPSAQFEPLEPLIAKGKSAPVRAWRLVQADRAGSTFERDFDTPLVDRHGELEQLRRAYRRSVDERTCHLFTLLGSAGIGKTRLASALFEALADQAKILVGRCLPYGDGITFWPLTEVLQEIGNVEDLVRDMDDAELIVERLRGVTGQTTVGSQETFWGVRKLCEALARQRPLVLCFEDVHWAEPTFLDLIEYLAGWIRDAPILLVCLARPEFIDERPAWLSGQEHAASLTLSPLSPSDSEVLLDALGVSGEARPQIAEAAGGNPLYAEQMAAMLAESGYSDGLFTIPPTIQALLAARLDRLTAEERAAIERAAVCGKEFWRDAVLALTPSENRERIGAVLMSLVRKDLVRPHRSAVRPDDAFHFGHVLIRDAAYAGIPKQGRSKLHERFADWAESTADDRAHELEEIVGYHLEQAFRYREQLGPPGEDARRLALRAGDMLAKAGDRAFARSDMPAAVNLLTRATALLDKQNPIRLRALAALGGALMRTGDFARAETVLDQALEPAAGTEDRRWQLRTLIEREFLRTFTNPGSSTDELVRVAETAIPLLEELGDDLGLAKAWWLRSEADVIAGRWEPRADALERALEHARRTEDMRDEAAIIGQLAQALEYGPTPVPVAIERCELLWRTARDRRAVEPAIESTLAALQAMEGRFEEARGRFKRAQSQYDDLGYRYTRAVRSLEAASVELLAGDVDAAVHELRVGYEALERMGEQGARSTIAAFLAHALVEQGRFTEAEAFTRISEETGAVADLVTQAMWRSARARCLAHANDPMHAEQLAQEAVELAESTDFLELRAGTLLDLAQVRGRTGRADTVPELVMAARDLYERKGNLVAAARTSSFLHEPVH